MLLIGAIGWDGAHAETVSEAQLAAGVPPSNNMAKVDIRQLLRTPELSPGTRADSYHSTAGSFLLVGEAVGREMVKLMESVR